MTWLFLHGFAGGPASWDDVAAHLRPRPRSRPPIVPWLPGHGEGAAARAIDPGFAANVDRVAALVRDTGQVHLVGYSLGARIALGLLARHRGRIRRATLIGVHPGLRGEAERAERAATDARWAALLRSGGIAAFTAAWDAQPLFASQARAPAAQARQRARRLALDPEGLARSLEELGLAQMSDYRTALRDAAASLPVTLVTGADDAKFGAIADELAAATPGLGVTRIPACGHNPLLEAPAALAALLASLDDVDALDDLAGEGAR